MLYVNYTSIFKKRKAYHIISNLTPSCFLSCSLTLPDCLLWLGQPPSHTTNLATWFCLLAWVRVHSEHVIIFSVVLRGFPTPVMVYTQSVRVRSERATYILTSCCR